MMKLPIYLLIILILCSFAAATTSWFTWGNNGFQGAGAGVDNILWGSNYPQGTTNLSNTSIVLANLFPPMVADWDGDFQNEIFIFTGTTISLYNNNLELVATRGLGGTQSGKACIFNLNNDADLEIAVVVDSTNLQIYEPVGSDIQLVRTFSVTATDDALCTVNWQGSENTIWTIEAAGGSIREIDAIVGTETLIYDVDNNIDFCTENTATSREDQFSNPYILDDLDSDTRLELIWVQGSSGGDPPLQINSYDVVNNSFDLANVSAFSAISGTCNSTSISVVQVGSSRSSRELAIRVQEGGSATHLGIFDSSGSIISGVGSGINVEGYKSEIAVADIDADALNEYCFLWNQTNVFCFNSVSQIPEYRWTIPAATNFQKFMAIGEYDQISEWQEIITPTGMFTPASAAPGALNEVLNLSTLTSEPTLEAMVYPVSVEDQTQFFKDLIIAEYGRTVVFDAQETAAVCGNAVCEIGESILNCPQDCTPAALSDVELVSVIINPSTATAWKNNTDVSVNVVVNSKSGANVAAQAILYQGSSFEDVKPFVENRPVNSSINFLFKANHTIQSGILRVIGRSEFDNTTERADFGFQVAINGVEFGDSEAEFDFTETPIAPEETDPEDNAIRSAFETIPTGGLGFDLIWYMIMAVVAFGIFFAGHVTKTITGVANLGAIVVIEIFLLVAGVKLGFVPVGIVIIVSIIGLLIIALFMRKLLFSADS